MRYLITGSCGTIGSSLLEYILTSKPEAEVLCLDNNEGQLFFQEQDYLQDERVRFFLADIRDYERLKSIIIDVDVIFHSAALKHVVMCERSPMDAIQTNIHGVNNIVRVASERKVGKVIFTSSDKAVNPTNVMGTSKLMGERIITAANSTHHSGETVFAATRFGNVLGSSGSVIPIFKRQIQTGGPVTLTDSEMTRFVMSIEQAVKLVVDSSDLAIGGEVFITKMPVIRIKDLASVMISELAEKSGFALSSIEIIEIGSKPGEKLYEELMSSEETRRAVELDDYFSVLPAFRGIYRHIDYDYKDVISSKVTNPYISENESFMSKDELGQFLSEYRLLEEPILEEPSKRYWPGDKK